MVFLPWVSFTSLWSALKQSLADCFLSTFEAVLHEQDYCCVPQTADTVQSYLEAGRIMKTVPTNPPVSPQTEQSVRILQHP